jgi:hypothetical protein
MPNALTAETLDPPADFLSDPSVMLLFTVDRRDRRSQMLVAMIIGTTILVACVAYVFYRKFAITRQQIEFDAPQDGVAAIYLDIREDTVCGLHILHKDGTVSEVRELRAA